MFSFISLFPIGFVLGTADYISNLRVQQHWPVDNFCFRRLNYTHGVGCSSSFGGNVGRVHLFPPGTVSEQVSALQGSAYIPYINDTDLSTELLDLFAASGKIVGVLVRRTQQALEYFSPDDTCPNRYSSYANNTHNCNWNDREENHMLFAAHKSYPFPIFLITDADTSAEIMDCHSKFNVGKDETQVFSKRQCALKLLAPMNAVENSRICRQRTRRQSFFTYPVHFCDPLEDANVFSFLEGTRESEKSPDGGLPTVILACRMDAFSLFNGLAPGANSAVGNMVALLTLAKALREMTINSRLQKNVLLAFFNGESFDYIGSSRFAADLQRGKFKYGLKPTDISSVIELNQLFLRSNHSKWYAHVDITQMKGSESDTLKSLLKHISADGHIATREDEVLPPASVHSILKMKRDIPVVVITNHEDKYTNNFYNSIYDDYSSKNTNDRDQTEHIFKLTTTLLGALSKVLLPETPPEVEINIDKEMIRALMDCYLMHPDCPTFSEVTDKFNRGLLRKSPYPLYIAVGDFPLRINPTTILTYLLLARHTGQVVHGIESLQDCVKLQSTRPGQEYRWMNGLHDSGLCIAHNASMMIARSPAFDDDYQRNDDRYHYSFWTESVWQHIEMSLFVEASGLSIVISLFAGCFIFVLSLVLALVMKRNVMEIFENPGPVVC